MGKYNYMNLNQKMIRIRKKVPKLIRKRYSEDVMILSILVDTFISKISLTMQPGPKIDSISGA